MGNFAGINYLAVLVAGVAGFMVGGVWYGVLGKQWMNAVGMDEKECKSSPKTTPMILAGVGNLIMALMLAGILGHVGQFSLIDGLIAGLAVWFGFVLTTLVVNNAFGMRPFMLSIIDAGHWLAVLLVIGAILGLFGV